MTGSNSGPGAHLIFFGSWADGKPSTFAAWVVGPGGSETSSHVGTLFLHQLVYWSMLVELHLEGVRWEENDLDLILEAVGDVSWSLGHFITVHIDQN